MSVVLKKKLDEIFHALPQKAQAEIVDFVEFKFNKEQKNQKKRSDKPRIAGLNRSEIWYSEDFADPLPDGFWNYDEDFDPTKRNEEFERKKSQEAQNK